MRDKVKNVVVTISFVFVLFFLFLANLIKPDTEVSFTERRKLQQFPKFSLEEVFAGSFFEKLDQYTMDQFVQREAFRSLKANFEMQVLRKQNSNNIYEYEGKLIEQIYPLNEKSISNLTKKMNEIHNKYLDETNRVYYAIVPDKNYFAKGSHLKLDYAKLKEKMADDLEWAEPIDLFDCLDLSCYYKTDSHWKQERLQAIADKIASQMGWERKAQYEEKKIADFKGVYAGQLPIKVENDEIRILTNDEIESCTVYHHETGQKTKIYDQSKINAPDKYDIYLSGATPLLTIENPKAAQEKELIVFRDSYGSSLIPLLIEEYSKITVIDTRYISPKILGDYVEFSNKDVLFLYSTMLINNSSSLK